MRERPTHDELPKNSRERREEQRFAITTDVFIEVYDAESRVWRIDEGKI